MDLELKRLMECYIILYQLDFLKSALYTRQILPSNILISQIDPYIIRYCKSILIIPLVLVVKA